VAGVHAVKGLRGAAIVTRAGRIRLEVAIGLADAQTGLKCTPETRFQICSISKQFTAVAVMLLAESGWLDVAEPVARWLPGCPPQWERVTTHHLLTHTAGVRHWGDAPGFDASLAMDPAERVALIQQAPLLAHPGARWQYSSPGYLLVAHIVEQAGGQPYADFLTEQILVPLGLTSTSVGSLLREAVARGYRGDQPVSPWPLSTMAGTGDICSTVGDVARFTSAVHSGSLIGPQSRQAMLTPSMPLPDGETSSDGWPSCHGYGYGHYLGRIGGHAAFLHTGDNPGYRSVAVWLPDQEGCVVVLSNDEATETGDLLRQLVPVAVESEER
jgi:CubicO group peptidase (beta-lactamase class C family)